MSLSGRSIWPVLHFFSSRRRHTRCLSDWSSDVCSSDLIPLVQRDFPLPMHPWSFDAAVNARFFDTKSAKLGDEYRSYIFQNQLQINKQNLRGMTERFADQQKVALPFVIDPNGDL